MKVLDLIRPLRYHVIRIDLSDPDSLPTACTVFKKERNKVDVVQYMELKSLDEILSAISKKSLIIAQFTGDQVLTRYTSESRSNLFEEIDENEFYLQKGISVNGWMIQSACRKSIVDPVLQRLVSDHFFLLDASLSPVALPKVESAVQNATFQIDHFQFEYKNQLLSGISEVPESGEGAEKDLEIEIAGTQFSPVGLSQLASLMHYFNEGPAHISMLREQYTQSKFYHRFRIASMLSLTGLFVLLLSNFLLLGNVQNKLIQLTSNSDNKTEQIRQIEHTKAQLEEYRDLVLYAEKSSNHTYSYYLEQIAQCRPYGVWFNSLLIHPAKNRQEKNKSIEVDPATILLMGEARDPVTLNRMISSLKETTWIQDIELLNYENSQEKPSAEFEISIKKKR